MAECRNTAVSNLNSSNQSVVNENNDAKEDNNTDRAMEPLLIEDLKPNMVPRSFQILQKSFFDKKIHLGRDDYLVLLIHVLMLEVGFIPRDCSGCYQEEFHQYHYRRILDVVIQLPLKWKSGTSCYFLEYLLPPFVTNDCQLSIMVFGEDMIVNCTVPNIHDATYSVLLDPTLYVMTSTTNIENKFQNMAHLSRSVKDSIGNPAKHSILIQSGLSGLYLASVPIEVIYIILNYLDTTDLAMIESTSRYFRLLANDRVLWKQIRGDHTEKSFFHFKRSELVRRGRNQSRSPARSKHL